MSPAFQIPPAARRAFTAMAGDLARVFGSRFVALVAYGRHRSAAFVTALTADDLDAISAASDTWHRDGLDTPLLLAADEFRRTLDVFPLEYQAILDRHEVIAGTPPFNGAVVSPEHLRRACEAQAKGHLIHLRQSWIDAGSHGHDLDSRIAGSAGPLRALLAHIARLDGHGGMEPAEFAGTRIGADRDVVTAVLALEDHPEGAAALRSRLGDYVAACERIWAFVDGWRA